MYYVHLRNVAFSRKSITKHLLSPPKHMRSLTKRLRLHRNFAFVRKTSVTTSKMCVLSHKTIAFTRKPCICSQNICFHMLNCSVLSKNHCVHPKTLRSLTKYLLLPQNYLCFLPKRLCSPETLEARKFTHLLWIISLMQKHWIIIHYLLLLFFTTTVSFYWLHKT